MHVTFSHARSARALAAGTIAIVAASLFGCGRVQDPLSSARTATSTVTSTSSASTASTTSGATSSTAATSATQTTIVTPPGTPRYALVDPKPFEDFDTLLSFRSPSGNIGCSLSDDAGSSGARCDIGEHTWSSPPRPADCELDYGSGLSISDGLADFTCAGDTVLGSGHVLAYKASIRFGAFVCDSDESGVTCSNTSTKHGFFLSRATYRVF